MCNTREIETQTKLTDEELDRRLNYARYLLTHTRAPLAEVAVSGGWRSEKTFIAAFRASVGVTPVRYRNWHQG